MSGIDQGMMPEYVKLQHPDDPIDERIANPDGAIPDEEIEVEQAQVQAPPFAASSGAG